MDNKVIKFEVGKTYKAARNCRAMIRVTRRTDYNIWVVFPREDGTCYNEEERRKISTFTSGWGESTEVSYGKAWEESYYAWDEIDYDSIVKCYKVSQEAHRRAREERISKKAKELQEWMSKEELSPEVVKKVVDKIIELDWGSLRDLQKILDEK